MNLRQLELFVAIADTGSFSRGAKKTSLTQSTASQHIAALEEEVSVRLFDRTQKGALLTAGGKLYLQHARRILAERDLLYQTLAGFSGIQEGSIQIGASNIPANYLIPAILPELALRYPGICLSMQTGGTNEVLQYLIEAEVELAVVGSRTADRNIDFTPLTTDTLVLIVGPQHPWRDQGMISLEDLASEPLVVRDSGSGSDQTLRRELQRINFNAEKLQIAAQLGSNEAVRQAVASGFGCAFVSERSVQREIERGELFQVSVGGMQVRRQFWVATLRNRTLSPTASAIAGLMLEIYAQQEEASI